MTDHWQPPEKPIPASVKQSRTAVFVFYFGMIGLFTANAVINLVDGLPLSVVIFLWLFSVLPLSIFFPGLRKNKLRTHAWLCFVVLLYFIHAVITAFVPGSLFYGIVYSLLCTGLFSALTMYIRLARKHLGMSLQE